MCSKPAHVGPGELTCTENTEEVELERVAPLVGDFVAQDLLLIRRQHRNLLKAVIAVLDTRD